MTSLTQYYQIAERILKSFCRHSKKGSFGFSCKEILQSDEELGEVAEAIMWADHDFNGKGNLYGYRKYRALQKIKSIRSKKKDMKKESKQWKYPKFSISSSPARVGGSMIKKGISNYSALEDIIPSNCILPAKYVLIKEAYELSNQILNTFPELHQRCFQLKIREGKSYQEIATMVGRTKQRCQQVVEISINKLVKEYERRTK